MPRGLASPAPSVPFAVADAPPPCPSPVLLAVADDRATRARGHSMRRPGPWRRPKLPSGGSGQIPPHHRAPPAGATPRRDAARRYSDLTIVSALLLLKVGRVGSSSASASPACHSSPLMELTFAGADKFGCPCAFGGGLGAMGNDELLLLFMPLQECRKRFLAGWTSFNRNSGTH
ncbi:uncharacterized protein [Aegilops tauschii subsp. strangulata]|uniref:uncharacterized protein n=1 Tax=Aegilops tauschii subsp. strangulata TaxID=200361 RepID=UPI003CC893D1